MSSPAAVLAAPLPPDLALLRRRERAAWAAGDGAVIGSGFVIVAENLVEFAELQAGERVLDVAAGSGNAALAAARRFAHVTGTDPIASLLDKGRERARAEGLPVTFQPADVEALPFADACFDLVLSSFGAMYAIDPAAAAREMTRVLKPGGRIALASWTPRGIAGQLLALVDRHVPAPAERPLPTRWGARRSLAALFGLAPAQIRCRRRRFMFRYRSAAHWAQVFRDFHGPTHQAFAALDARGQQALEREIVALLSAANTAGAGALAVPADYLEAVVTPHADVRVSAPAPSPSHP